MPLILDSYNILHVVGVLPPELAGLDVAGLLDLLARSRYGGQKALLVCDGLPPPDGPTGSSGPRQVLYSGPGRTADDLIIQCIHRCPAPRRLTVVSSDRAIRREARRHRCRTLRSEQILQHLADDAEAGRSPAPGRPGPRGPLSREEVDQWLDLFAVDIRRLRDEARRRAEEMETAAAPDEPPVSPPPPPPPRRRKTAPERPRTPAAPPPLPDEILREAERLWTEAGEPGDGGESPTGG